MQLSGFDMTELTVLRISNYELGQRDIPTEILIRLAKYYNISVDYLLGLTDTQKRL